MTDPSDRALLEMIYMGSFKFKPARERDVLAVIAMHRQEGFAAGVEAAAKVCEAETDYMTVTPFVHRERLAHAIRAIKPD